MVIEIEEEDEERPIAILPEPALTETGPNLEECPEVGEGHPGDRQTATVTEEQSLSHSTVAAEEEDQDDDDDDENSATAPAEEH